MLLCHHPINSRKARIVMTVRPGDVGVNGRANDKRTRRLLRAFYEVRSSKDEGESSRKGVVMMMMIMMDGAVDDDDDDDDGRGETSSALPCSGSSGSGGVVVAVAWMMSMDSEGGRVCSCQGSNHYHHCI